MHRLHEQAKQADKQASELGAQTCLPARLPDRTVAFIVVVFLFSLKIPFSVSVLVSQYINKIGRGSLFFIIFFFYRVDTPLRQAHLFYVASFPETKLGATQPNPISIIVSFPVSSLSYFVHVPLLHDLRWGVGC